MDTNETEKQRKEYWRYTQLASKFQKKSLKMIKEALKKGKRTN